MRYIPRQITDRLLASPKNKATLLLGARQVGKSTLLKHLLSEVPHLWVSGDDPKTCSDLSRLISPTDLKQYIGDNKVFVIDEAQRIDSIGLLLKRLVDLQLDCRIMATGSSSLDLASGVFESAAGRIRAYQLMTFSLEELTKFFGWGEVSQNLSDRLVYGNYPFVVEEDPFEAEQNLSMLFQSVAFKDIFSLSGIRKPAGFTRLVEILAYRIGGLCTVDSLAKECGLSASAVENYLSLLEQCFLIKVLPSFSKNLANELKKSKKIYFCDVGLRNAAIGDFRPFSTRPPEEQGELFENFFIMERIKFSLYRNPLTRHYFWRTKNRAEVDLIEVNNQQMTAFEVKLSRENVAAPPSFLNAYPDADFFVVNQHNLQKYLLEQH